MRKPLLALFIAAYSSVSLSAEVLLNRITAVVNDDVVLQSELDLAQDQARATLRQQGIDPNRVQGLREQVLDQLIADTLKQQRAEQIGIRISDRELNAQINSIAQRNGLNMTDFLAEVSRQSGMSPQKYRETLRKQMTAERLLQADVIAKIAVTDAEIDETIARLNLHETKVEYNVSHILVALPEAATPEQHQGLKGKAEKVLKQAIQGADFAQLAVENSDSSTALKGGELGWKTQDQLPNLFADALKNLKSGEVSSLLPTPSGFHILKLNDKRNANVQLITETSARHILIKPEIGVSDADQKAFVEKLREEILAGADFATLAKEHSDDPGSAIKGGQLSWMKPGETVPPFEAAMNALKPGELSQPLQTQFGWHLIEVLERREQDVSNDMLRQKARQALLEQKLGEEQTLWLRRLRDSANVEMIN